MGNILTKFISKMAALTPDCDSLSVRQHKLNAAVNEAFKNKLTLDEVVSSENETDIDNIFKIDLASKYRNVDYIIENLKSTDSLRVTRALKARWLFTDNEYSHIVNPAYVSKTLQPLMSDKAFNKFMSKLACHVSDEKRCEEFYMHFVQMKNERYLGKFLLKCSIPFIKSRIATNDFNITPEYLLLLSLKSQEILVAYIESERDISNDHIYALKHLIDTHGDFYLNLLENHISNHGHPYKNFGQRVTREIIRNHKERIFKLPYIYLQLLHFKQLAHALTQDEVKHLAFLIGKHEDVWRNDILKSLIMLLPRDEQYGFIKLIFVKLLTDQDFEMNTNFETYNWYEYMNDEQREEWALKHIAQRDEHVGKFYRWYKFVGFSKAFVEMKKLLRAEPDASEREEMFEILVSSCDDNESNILKLLKYYHDRHINEIILFKQNIIKRIMEEKYIYKCASEVWNVLNEILLSLRIYENENNCSCSFKQCAITHVIAHRIIYDKPVTGKMFQLYERHYTMLGMMITTPWKEKVFTFLYNWLVAKINEQDVTDPNSRDVAMKWTNELIDLIKSYEHPVNAEVVGLIRKIRERDSNAFSNIICTEILREFFAEEQPLHHEDVCLQILKRDVASLESLKAKFDAKIQSNVMKYRRFLSKIRIYFSKDFALEWRKYYLGKFKENLEDSTGCACVLNGLSILMPAPEYEELMKQYQPQNAKLVWSDTDPQLVHIQTNIAKFMHLVRPTVNCELLASFAKGDFHQYSVNSLISIGRQLPQEQCQTMIVKLLASPVSVQKHGIRMAFTKFTIEELIDIFGKMWDKSKNVSVRQLLFNSVHDLLIATEDDTKCLAIWSQLNTFMTQLHRDEFIHNIVNPIQRGLQSVSLSVRPQYCIAYWHLLQTAQYCDEICAYRIQIIETMTDDSLLNLLDEEFLKDLILGILPSLFHEGSKHYYENMFDNSVWSLIAKYIVLCLTEEVAEQRKCNVLTVITQETISNWNVSFDGKSAAERFLYFLKRALAFSKDILYNDEVAFYNPTHILEYVHQEIDTKLRECEHYAYRLWLKFAIILIRSLSESRVLEPAVCPDNCRLWVEIFSKYVLELMRIEVPANYPHLPQIFGYYINQFVKYDCGYTYAYQRECFYIGISKVLLEEKEDIHCLALAVKLLNKVSQYCEVRPEADVVLNALREMNISELNLSILCKNYGWSPFRAFY